MYHRSCFWSTDEKLTYFTFIYFTSKIIVRLCQWTKLSTILRLFYPPGRDILQVIPCGVPFESLSVIFLTSRKLLDFKNTICNRPFFPQFSISRGGIIVSVIRYGVPFESLSIYMASREKFFYFINTICDRPFLVQNFVMDGVWCMGPQKRFFNLTQSYFF